MKKIMIGILGAAILAIIAAFCINWKTETPLYQSEMYTPLPPIQQSSNVSDYLAGVNKRAAAIQDFNCSLNAKVYRRLTINLTGGIVFDKPLQSSIYMDSRFGREVLVGSNTDEFWFYSKRMDSPALYYAKHSDLYKTRLKAPFHPMWMMQGLGLEPITFSSTPKFEKDGKYVRAVAEERGPNGRYVRRVVLIDPEKEVVRGNYLYDEGNKLLASIEINNYVTVSGLLVPQKMRMVWVNNDDKSVMDMELTDLKVNTGQRSVQTRPTKYGPQIDMAK